MAAKSTECVKVSSTAALPLNEGCRIHHWCLLQVVVRCRPFSEQENLDKRQQTVTVLPQEQQIQECHMHSHAALPQQLGTTSTAAACRYSNLEVQTPHDHSLLIK